MPRYVPGSGNANAKLILIGEAPGKSEDEEGKPFVGPSGEFLWEVLSELGMSREDVWTTNVYKYRPPNNDIKRIGEVCNKEQQLENLWKEINSVNPNVIFCMGNTAFHAVRGHSGIMKWRGSILATRYGDRKLVGSIHPANIVRSTVMEAGSDYKSYPYIWKMIFTHDLQRAIKESLTSSLDLEPRYVKICRDSMELYRYVQQNKNRVRMSTDIESINCIPVCVSLCFDRHESLVVPLFNRLGPLNFGGIPASDQSFIWQTLDKLLKEKDIVGQNFKYDQDKMQMLGFSFRRGRPIVSDTLLKTHTIIPELPSKRMEMLQSLWTRLPYHKDEGKEYNPKKDKIDKLFHYCGLDAISTKETDEEQDNDLTEMSDELHLDMHKFYYDYVMKLHEVYLDMENIGFRLDTDAQLYLKIKYQSQHDMIQMRLSAAIPDFKTLGKKCHNDHLVNVASPQQMSALLYGYLGLPKRTKYGKVKADEDTIVGLLNNVIKDDRRRNICTDIIEDRRTRKTLGTYVLAKPDHDGRIRGSYRITGTETARSSTAILKPPLRLSKSGHAFQTLTKHGTVGADIRTMYICDPGFVFVQIDLSQAEPRIVANLSRDDKLLQAFESGKVDIHRRTAALVLDMTPELDLGEEYNEAADTIGKDSPERFLGKKCRNGGNYDMGKGELALNIATDAKRFRIDVSVSEWRAGKMLESFHRESPNIRNIFHREIQEAINSSRILVNPFGRARQFFERLDKKTYGEGYAHIPQSCVADKVKTSILKSKAEMPDFHKMLMGEAHDALLFRFPINEWEDRARLVKLNLEEPIDFSVCTLKRLPLRIPADVEVSFTNYKDLERVKI
jgi:uracil-DNA glycosylase family 4